MASVMTVYAPGQVAIGHVQDCGPDKGVLADALTDDGRFVSLGVYQDRRAGREAVEEMHRSRTGQSPRPLPKTS
jgi:hypothetical protein